MKINLNECIFGQEIVRITTQGTQYDNGCIALYSDKDERYLMKVEEILKIDRDFNSVLFNITKKRIHKYLEVD